MQAENSEVLPLGSVAVAVTTAPAANVTPISVALMLALQLASVVTIVEPR